MFTRIFKSGNSQAVRIPKELSFDSNSQEVEIERRGDELIIRPLRTQRLDRLRSSLQGFSVDFMAEGRIPEREHERPAF